jgi:hypothetical protein
MKNAKLKLLMLLAGLFLSVSRLYTYELRLTLSGEERYDDNAYSAQTDAKKDLITNLILGLGIQHEGEATLLDVIGHVTQQLYAINHDLSSNYQDLTLNFRHDFTRRNRLAINDIFQHYPEPQNFLDDFERFGAKNTYIVNSFMTSYDHALTGHLSLNAKYSNRYNHYFTAVNTDSMQQTGLLAVNASLSSSHIVSAGYSYTHSTQKAYYNTDIQSGYVSYMYYFTKTLYSTLRGGADYISVNNESIIKPYYYASVQNDIDDRTHLNVSYQKQTATSMTDSSLNTNWRINAEINHTLSKRLRGGVVLFYGNGIYEMTRVRYSLAGINTSVRYDLTNSTQIYLRYSFSRWKSSVSSDPITRNVVALGGGTSF